MSAQWYDANISLPGCDKNMPGTIMAMARLNRPSLMIYGGARGGGRAWQHALASTPARSWHAGPMTCEQQLSLAACTRACFLAGAPDHRSCGQRGLRTTASPPRQRDACSPKDLPPPHRPAAGTIKPGHSRLGGNDTLDIVSAFQSFGGYTAGLINEEQVRPAALPWPRGCTHTVACNPSGPLRLL